MPTTWGTASSTRVKSGRISSSVPESRFMNRHSRPSGNWLQNWTWPGVSPVNCELEVIVGDETGFKCLETAGTYTLAPVLMRRDAVQSSNLLASPMIALSPFGVDMTVPRLKNLAHCGAGASVVPPSRLVLLSSHPGFVAFEVPFSCCPLFEIFIFT